MEATICCTQNKCKLCVDERMTILYLCHINSTHNLVWHVSVLSWGMGYLGRMGLIKRGGYIVNFYLPIDDRSFFLCLTFFCFVLFSLNVFMCNNCHVSLECVGLAVFKWQEMEYFVYFAHKERTKCHFIPPVGFVLTREMKWPCIWQSNRTSKCAL